MRALVFDQSLSLRPRHPEPQPRDGDTLLRVRQAGVCSTDLEITRGYMGFHGVLGHEFVAEVVSSPNKDLVGQRVAGEINVVCGRCDLCLSGLSSHCRNRRVLGILKRDGAFADYVRLPPHMSSRQSSSNLDLQTRLDITSDCGLVASPSHGRLLQSSSRRRSAPRSSCGAKVRRSFGSALTLRLVR